MNRPPLLVALALLSAACGTGSGDDTTPATSTTTAAAAWQSCEAPRAGYALEYPHDWHTNVGEVVETCHWFNPRPFQLAPATDVFGIAVHVRVLDGPVDAHARRVVESTAARVVLRENRTVAGHTAVVAETESTGLVEPAGSRTYTYFVDADGRTVVGSASQAGARDGVAYGEVKAVLDRMVASLRVTPRAARCSADGLSATPATQPGLPVEVATTRRTIVDAATQCDYARLAQLASSGRRPFTAGFGGVDDLAASWQRGEAGGERPLHALVTLLDAPHARRAAAGDPQFVWPSAFAAERWADVASEAREALRPLYDDEDFAAFQKFGSYVGYRIGIAEDGEWLFFVAGD
ncbi:MAG TPA: hypothetical protein VM938_15495 [Acidimicrobiales bacterium]|nr:hypothetical protein [Acidimicrobiales bacterium]